MANAKESESRAAVIIKNGIRTRYTLEFLVEQINNSNFKVAEFDHFKMSAIWAYSFFHKKPSLNIAFEEKSNQFFLETPTIKRSLARFVFWGIFG